MLKKIVHTDDDVSRFVLRVLLGVVMFPHGAGKFLGWFGGGGFLATMNGLTGMGLSAPIAFLVIMAEFLGSLGLVVGFLARIAALGIGAVMAGAIYLVHWKHGFFMNWYGAQAGEGFEYHLLAIAIALALVIKGAGRWSVDRALSQK